MDDALDNAIIYLIRQDRFYAEMLHRMKKRFTTDVDTLGVGVNMEGLHLSINPYMFNAMTVPEQAECLKHECEHPMRGLIHGSGREKSMAPDLYKNEKTILEQMKEMSTHYLLNIAEDAAINETLPNLPKIIKHYNKDGTPKIDEKTGKPIEGAVITVKSLQAMFPDDKIEPNQAAEYYYSFLKQKRDEGKFKGEDKEGNMFMPLDDHNMLDEALKAIDPQLAKAIVAKLIEDAKDATPGKAPGHVQLALEELNKKVKDWRQDVQMFSARCQNSEEESTFRRRNRRYGLLYPGRRVKVKSVIAVPVDTSGSVSDKALRQFLSEIEAIAEAGVDVIVIECDSVISNVYKFEPGKIPQVKGRGGTSFEPAFKLVESEEFIAEYGEIDGLIYLTDGGDYGELVEEPNFPVLWALLPHCSVRYDWGEQTIIEVS